MTTPVVHRNRAGCPLSMSITSLPRTPGRFAALSALDRSQRIRLGAAALIHLVALGTLFATEHELFHLTLAALTWTGLNLFFLSILRRPLMSAMLSLGSILT